MAKQTMKFKATQYIVRINYADNYFYNQGEIFSSIEEFNQSVQIRRARMNHFDEITVSLDILNNEGTSIWRGRHKLTHDKTPFCLISRIKAYRESLAKMECTKNSLAGVDSVIRMLEEVKAEAPAPAPEETPVADTEPTPADDDYNDENHGDLAIELPHEYAVFNLHGKYEELANVMHDRLEKQFSLTDAGRELFGDSDEPVTIADIDDILDDNAYDGWNVFVDGWWDDELRLYAQRDGADIENDTPSRYSDWHMIDADHGYLTIGTPV